MKLVIVESPTKTKSIGKFLGKDYTIMATMGHMRDLPKSSMGVEIKKEKSGYKFEPEYELNKDKTKNAASLKTAALKADKVILASDPDREGEAIAWHTMALLSEGKKGVPADKFERITFHSITKDAIQEAINEPRKIDMDLVNAQQARRILDRIVGYKLSPVLWKKVRRGLSAGRVQSVAVRLVVEREKEIKEFKAEEYWSIRVELINPTGDVIWTYIVKIKGKTAKITNGETAKQIEDDLNKSEYIISDLVKKERNVYPHPPFKTSTLQQAAANVLGWSAKKTMSVAQRLYEQGAITYHRTDSLNLAAVAIGQIREIIAKQLGAENLPEKEIFYKTSGKVVAQEAHEAIRPAHLEEGVESVKVNLDKDEAKLYELVWRRTIACQMKPAVIDQTVVLVSAGEYELKTQGETLKFASWKKLYKAPEEVILPKLEKGEKLSKKDIKLEQKFTQPPARFNDASLIKELEKRGIGRPSTYAPTIATIIDRGYVEQKQKRFFATSVGEAVVEFLVKNFPKEMEYEFTAKMEENLDEIASGKVDWEKVLSEFYGPFEKQVETAGEKAERVKMAVESTGQECPLCGIGEVVIRTGRFGRFYSCSRFPECKYTARLIEYLEGVTCPKDSGKVVVKKTRTGREFYGCENYPKCDWASWSKPKVEGAEEGPGPERATGEDEEEHVEA